MKNIETETKPWIERPKLTQFEIALIERIFKLGFDYHTLSDSGKQTYNELCSILGVSNPEEIESEVSK